MKMSTKIKFTSAETRSERRLVNVMKGFCSWNFGEFRILRVFWCAKWNINARFKGLGGMFYHLDSQKKYIYILNTTGIKILHIISLGYECFISNIKPTNSHKTWEISAKWILYFLLQKTSYTNIVRNKPEHLKVTLKINKTQNCNSHVTSNSFLHIKHVGECQNNNS